MSMKGQFSQLEVSHALIQYLPLAGHYIHVQFELMEVARLFLLLPGNEGRTPVAYGGIQERKERGGV